MVNQAIAAIIEDQDGKFLLHLRDEDAPTMKNQWCLVGGGIEENETLEEVVRREIKEETGLKAKEVKFFEQFVRKDKPQQVFIFHVRVDTRKQNLKLGEGREIKFFTPKEIMKLVKNIGYSNQYLKSIGNFIQKEEEKSVGA